MTYTDRSITCPCNNRTVELALLQDGSGWIAVCPSCNARTIPSKSKASALRQWVAMRLEATTESVPT